MADPSRLPMERWATPFPEPQPEELQPFVYRPQQARLQPPRSSRLLVPPGSAALQHRPAPPANHQAPQNDGSAHAMGAALRPHQVSSPDSSPARRSAQVPKSMLGDNFSEAELKSVLGLEASASAVLVIDMTRAAAGMDISSLRALRGVFVVVLFHRAHLGVIDSLHSTAPFQELARVNQLTYMVYESSKVGSGGMLQALLGLFLSREMQKYMRAPCVDKVPLFVWSPDRVLYLLAEHLTASGLGPVVAMVPEACPHGLMGATKDAMRALKVLKEEDGQVGLRDDVSAQQQQSACRLPVTAFKPGYVTLLLPRGGLTHVPVPTTKAALDTVITAKGLPRCVYQFFTQHGLSKAWLDERACEGLKAGVLVVASTASQRHNAKVDAGDPVRSFWSQDLGAAHTDYPVIDYVYRGIVTSSFDRLSIHAAHRVYSCTAARIWGGERVLKAPSAVELMEAFDLLSPWITKGPTAYGPSRLAPLLRYGPLHHTQTEVFPDSDRLPQNCTLEMILAVRPAMRHCSAVVLVDGEQPFVMNGGWSHDIGWLVMHQKPLPAKALGYSDMERSMFAEVDPVKEGTDNKLFSTAITLSEKGLGGQQPPRVVIWGGDGDTKLFADTYRRLCPARSVYAITNAEAATSKKLVAILKQRLPEYEKPRQAMLQASAASTPLLRPPAPCPARSVTARRLIPSAGQPGPAGRSGPAKQGSPQQHHAAITAAGLPSATMQANGGSHMAPSVLGKHGRASGGDEAPAPATAAGDSGSEAGVVSKRRRGSGGKTLRS